MKPWTVWLIFHPQLLVLRLLLPETLSSKHCSSSSYSTVSPSYAVQHEHFLTNIAEFFEGLALGSCIAALPNTRMLYKLIMASLFALITPLGMAIGIGVLNQFNGNDSSTLIAIGTLDAFSAGILIWVGLVEMLAHDWFHGPALVNAGGLKAGVCGFALICGMVLMSVLGKWA